MSVAVQHLLVFARCPEAGKTKTRLIPALGAVGAARVHHAMITRTLDTVRQWRSITGMEVELCLADGESRQQEMAQSFGSDIASVGQVGEDLGKRLEYAIRRAFGRGVQRVLVIGTDCPEISAAHIQQAGDLLQSSDLVLGPARDGGYYLIGLKACIPELFQGISWGTETVLDETMQVSRRLQLKTSLLPPLSDVDCPEDLIVWRRFCGSLPEETSSSRRPEISVIIPTLNEADEIERTLQRLTTSESIEVIVCDGGSRDGTPEIAARCGARVISTRPGRGRQMNAGAAIANGETLLFLHGDTRLPEDFPRIVLNTLASQCSAGAFRLRIDGPRHTYRLVESGANLRSRILQLPYGDQGLFLKASQFFQMDGFADLPFMEDFELCCRLRRMGRIRIAPEAVTTSDRRWQTVGAFRTTIVNQLCVAGYLLGVSPRVLARLYAHDGDSDLPEND